MLPPTIGKYEVAHRLGEGAMGEVFLARDPFIGRSVAVKLMKTDSAGDRERFLQEARTVGALSHPNIVVLHDFGFHDGRPFLVMEFVPGRNLEDWLRDPHTLDEHLKIVEGLCRALLYAHERGVLHRDLKPSNVQVLPEGDCKLMDFGIARTGTGRLTTAHTVLGTPSFIAPEILEEAAYSASADVYSAGVLVYEMLAGVNPFAGKTVASTLHNVLNRQPPHLLDQRPELPAELCHAVMACLARAPGQRPRDVARLLEVARRARAAGPDAVGRTLSPGAGVTASLRLSPLRRVRRAAWPAAGVALTLALGALLALQWPHAAEAPPAPVPVPTAAAQASPRPAPLATLTPSAAPRRVTGAARPADPPRQTPMARAVPSAIPTPAPQAAFTTPEAAPSPLGPQTASSSPVPPSAFAPPATAAARPSPQPSALAPARLTRLVPRRAGRRATVALEIEGHGLRRDHRVRVLRGQREAQGIRVVREEIVGPELARVTLLVDEDVPPGLYSVMLVDPQARATNSLSLEVTL